MENPQTHSSEELEIDFVKVFRKLINNKKALYKATGIGALIGIIVSFSLPKTYKVDVILSPESGMSNGGSLAGIASMFGLGGAAENLGEDAVTFSMFPEIVKTTPFALEMLQIPIKTQDNKEMTLYDYLDIEKKPWWNYVIGVPGMAIGGIMSLFKEEEKDTTKNINPFQLTAEQSQRIGMFKKIVKVKTDKKTSMTTVSISLQDPIATAIVADSAINKLQSYVIEYRTKKAKQDYEFQDKMSHLYKDLYEKAQNQYNNYVDANRDLSTQAAKSQMNEYRQNANLAYQVYSQVLTQKQVAESKIQEAKPVFAVIEPATIPLHANSPKKGILIIGFAFLACLIKTIWILLAKETLSNFKNELKQKNDSLN